jgi:hypothetical protein
MQQMDALVREIGDRGKIKSKIPEAVPPRALAPAKASAKAPALAPGKAPAPAPTFEPSPEPAPTPTLAPEPAPTPAPTRAPTPAAAAPATPQRVLAPASTPDHGFSPSMQQLSPGMPMVQHVVSAGGSNGSLSKMSSFFKEQREEAKAERAEAKAERVQMEARMEAKDARIEQQRKEMEAKIEQQRLETQAIMEQHRKEKEAKMEQQHKEMETKIAELTPAPPAPAITDEQLAALQARIEGLHVTKLLADEELFALEDLIADYVELTMSVTDRVITKEMIYSLPIVSVASKLDKLVGLSAAMVGDAAFARQARRKFL